MESKYKTIGEQRAAAKARGKISSKNQKQKLNQNKTFFKIGPDGREYWNECTNLNFITGMTEPPAAKKYNSLKCLDKVKFPRTW